MIKSDLRENGFAEMVRNPKESKINLLWVPLTLIIIAGMVVSVFLTADYLGIGELNSIDPLQDFLDSAETALGGMGAIIVFILIPIIYILVPVLLYLSLRLLMTIFVCKDRNRSIKLNILKRKAIPICECKEALRVWQTILIYIAPIILTFAPLFTLTVLSYGNPAYLGMICISAFYWAFDITLVLHVLRIKIKEGVDYISVDYHVYSMTLYEKSYVRRKKSVKSF